ncbi:MAG: hypothetical protein OIF54_12290 [Cohaesibacter sp.]|nr:hypothetical protein [Cohaesibacter sp.]
MPKMLLPLATTLAFAGLSSAAFGADLTIQGTAKMDAKGKIAISGSGFKPDSDVMLLFTTADGVESDVTYALDPAPVADAKGRFTTTWSYGRFVKKKLVSPGSFTLKATDADFAPLGETTITFAK